MREIGKVSDLSPAQRDALADFVREMQERVIPDAVRALEARAEAARKWRRS